MSLVYTESRSKTSTATFNGVVGVTYDVLLRVRAVVGLKTYTGGTPVRPYVVDGGTPAADNADVVRLTISNPSKVYHLNAGVSDSPAYNVALDYGLVVRITHGATVTLFHDNIDYRQYKGGPADEVLTAGGLSMANFATWVQIDLDATTDLVTYTVRRGAGVRGWLWSAFGENVYGVKADR